MQTTRILRHSARIGGQNIIRCQLHRPQVPSPSIHIIRQHQKRHAATFADNARQLFRKHPISVSLACGTILVGVLALGYANYIYQSYIIGAFHNYPEPVAQKLRRAVYYTNYDVRPQEAIKYYKQALQVANEVGMDPLSDEIIGIKLQVAGLMERYEQYSKAIQVLEIVRKDSLTWVENDSGEQKLKRTRLLAKAVALSVKLGDLYANPAIYNREMAEDRLTWAVETALRERQRRSMNQLTDDDEGPWLDDDQLGASMEALASQYEERGYNYLATPLLLQALELYKKTDCHAVVLMSNIASSLAQQSPGAAQQIRRESPATFEPQNLAPNRESLIAEAEHWARRAIQTSERVAPEVRDSECDVACAVALHHLGQIAEMLQKSNDAKRSYTEGLELSRRIGFSEGIEANSSSLKALKP